MVSVAIATPSRAIAEEWTRMTFTNDDVIQGRIIEGAEVRYTNEGRVYLAHVTDVDAEKIVLSDAHHFGLGPGDRVAQTSSAAYDSSVEEMWLAWGAGATLGSGVAPVRSGACHCSHLP